MRLSVRMKRVEEKINTTKLEPCGEPAPMDNYYINTELLNSLPLGEELMLFLSDKPFAEGEVTIALPPVPFYKLLKNTARYEHRTERAGKTRRAANTPGLPVTLAYVKKSALEDEFIAARKPIYYGICAVAEAAVEEPEPAAVDDAEIADEVTGADTVAVFDDFLRASVRVQRGGRLTTRQIWSVWAARCGADPADKVVVGVRFMDVSRRFHATFGATAAKNPARIDGSHQRYWSGYTI